MTNNKKVHPLKNKLKRLSKNSGRNCKGRVTVHHKGGGHKQKSRSIDYKLNFKWGLIETIEYSPNTNSYISRVLTNEGNYHYIITFSDAAIGQKFYVYSLDSEDINIKSGNRLHLKNIPLGSSIHMIELKRGLGSKLVKSAGSFATLLRKDIISNFGCIRLPSGEERFISLRSMATLGSVSNNFFFLKKLKKAGNSRWRGIRPTVRGVAMNPVDHPHGGGEGKTSGGRVSVTPWGHLTKGKRTRKKVNKLILVRAKQK
jgi:large subunit ribosomal protein L2